MMVPASVLDASAKTSIPIDRIFYTVRHAAIRKAERAKSGALSAISVGDLSMELSKGGMAAQLKPIANQIRTNFPTSDQSWIELQVSANSVV